MLSYKLNVTVPVSGPLVTKPPPSLAVSLSAAPKRKEVSVMGRFVWVTTVGVALSTLTTTVSGLRPELEATAHVVPESTLVTSARADVAGTGW